MHRITILSFVTLMASLHVGSVMAQDDAWSRKGKFWFHANAGPGFAQATADDTPDGKIKVSGAAAIGGLSLGAYLSDDLTVFGDIAFNAMSGPTFDIGGTQVTTTDAVTVTIGGFGGGLGYYIVPNGLFIQASAIVSIMTLEAKTGTDTFEAETNPGIGFRISIGNDWLISRKVALGVAGHGYYGSMKDKGENAPTWKTLGVGITFSFGWVPKGFRAPE